MHVTIGAAILILGLLFMAQTREGRKVLGAVALFCGVCLALLIGAWVHYGNVQQAKWDQERAVEAARVAAIQPTCDAIHAKHANDPTRHTNLDGWLLELDLKHAGCPTN